MVFTNAETVPVINIKTGISSTNGSTLKFLRSCVKETMTPLFSKAMEIIINDRTVIVAEFEKPEIASSGETKPVMASTAMIRKAVLSTEKTSKAKSITVTSRIEKTSIISKVIFKI